MKLNDLLPQIRDLPIIKKSNLRLFQDKRDFAFDNGYITRTKPWAPGPNRAPSFVREAG